MSTVTQIPFANFARDLVTSGELDPPYILINGLRESRGQSWAEAFSLYYFMFYDLEGAAKAAKAPSFWKYVEDVYPTAKRVAARRHFRGDKGWQALLALQRFGSPAQVWQAMHRHSYRGLVQNIERNFQGCQIGPYFAWKAMDILDRCLGMSVNMSLGEAIEFLPDVPRKGIKALWPEGEGQLVHGLVAVAESIANLDAPGAPTRKCSYPEAETVLCAIYGYQKGTYKVGSDLVHRRQELQAHPDLIELLPIPQNWSQYDANTLVA